ncbi:hypothetical protein AHF37_07707 [Paragonimus kellicotti]|nr:hypothetical protein AHF37_07707 [Paragonimus kellicotti]
MEVDYQYQVDYAKSGRAGCVKCKCSIAQNTLRIARLVQSTHFDGKIPKWFHFDCFFTKNAKVKATSEIKYFDSLRWEDQEKIRVAIGSVDAAATTKPNVAKLTIKLALPGQDCSVCKIALLQDALRQQSKLLWKMRDRLEREVTKDALIGLLEYNEQHVPSGLSNLLDAVSDAMVFGALPLCPSCKNGPLRYSNGQYKCSAMATDWAPCLYNTRDVERKQFQVPNEYFDVEFLKQYKFIKRTRLFAANSASLCTGPLSDYAVFVADDQSNATKTKENLVEECRALGASVTYKLSSGVLVVCASATAMEQIAKKDKARMKSMGLRVVDRELLSELKLSSSTKLSQRQLVKLLDKHTLSDWAVKHAFILSLPNLACPSPLIVTAYASEKLQALQLDKGGSFSVFRAWGRIGTTIGGTKVEKFTTASAARHAFEELYFEKTGNEWKDRENFQKKPGKFYEMELDYADVEEKSQKLSQNYSIPSKLDTSLQQLIQFICDIESMKQTMIEFEVWVNVFGLFLGLAPVGEGFLRDNSKWATSSSQHMLGKHGKENFTNVRETDELARFKLKGGAVVDPDSGLDNRASVLKDAKGTPMSAVLGMVDLVKGSNSFYKYVYVFVYAHLDLRKMPLGKLSKRQLHEAYAILGNLSKLMDRATKTKAALDQTVLLSESTRFFTLIPHDFGMRAPPLLSTRKAIKDKLQMLEDLLEIELAYNILKTDVTVDENPLDQHYHQLNTNLKPLDPTSDEYNRIVEYTRRTHGSTHRHYSLTVEAIFDVERPDEKQRFDSFKPAQHNKLLLWHGSRRTNWVGIFRPEMPYYLNCWFLSPHSSTALLYYTSLLHLRSQGLRIAPPEAPVTGYMFGKGIYFADIVSKSANYCYTSQSQPEGVLLLCEVILGNMKECYEAESTDLPADKHSRKGET